VGTEASGRRSNAAADTGRTSVRQEYKTRTRQRLTEAAIVEFEERGYGACTIEDVARRAGTSRATFYVHFSGKAELAEGLWDLTRRTLIALYRELGRYPVRDLATIESWLVSTFDFYAENRQRLVAIHEAIVLEPTLAEVYYDRTGDVADLVAPLIAEARPEAAASARFKASLLTIQHERFCYFWLLRGMPFDREEAIHGLAEVWFEQLGHRGGPVPAERLE
jgi:AcrR family transcriptional regulator